MLAVKPRTHFDLTNIFAQLVGVQKIGLAVSGGSDSLAMMHLVFEWAQNFSLPPEIFVLSVDHGLRPEAAGECAQVAGLSKSLGLAHVTLHWRGEKPKTGVQAKARKARYDLMSAWCLENQVPILLTAHTADDQAETVVMRQKRTTSVKSLAGIWPERDWNGVRVVRPLLSHRRQELRDYLSERGVEWIDDPSNSDLRYERVRIRAQLSGDVAAADLASEAMKRVMLDQANALAWFQSEVAISETSLLKIPVDQFSVLASDVKDEVLGLVFRCLGLAFLPDLQKRLALLDWLMTGKTNRRTLGGAVFAKRTTEVLVGREPGRISSEIFIIPESGELLWDGRFLLKGPIGAQVRAAGHFSQIPRRRDTPAFIDAGLPVVCAGNVVLAAPFHGIGAGVVCEYIGFKHIAKSWNYNRHTLC